MAESTTEREAKIRQAFREMSTNLQIREEVVVGEFRRESGHREKWLRLEKDELEFVVAGLQGAIAFGSLVLQEGSDVEVATERGQVVERLENLLVLAEELAETRKNNEEEEGEEEEEEEALGVENTEELSKAINMFGKLV